LSAAGSQIDALLLPYIHAKHEADSERLLTALVSEFVEPVIRQVIRSKLRVRFDHRGRASNNPDAEDLYSETLVQLLARLKQLKASPEDKAIGDLRGYVAVSSRRCGASRMAWNSPAVKNSSSSRAWPISAPTSRPKSSGVFFLNGYWRGHPPLRPWRFNPYHRKAAQLDKV